LTRIWRYLSDAERHRHDVAGYTVSQPLERMTLARWFAWSFVATFCAALMILYG
jgi:hypothetical protein